MNQVLKTKQVVKTEPSGLSCEVGSFLGGGGQGEVYRATLGDDKDAVALKWYYPASATPKQRSALETLIMKGPPDPRFLWPMEIAVASGVPGFGYVMPLREPHYKNIVDLMKKRIDPDLRALASAGYNLAEGFHQLHSGGLCYRDISWGNVFFEPTIGDVRICDNDNVGIDGEPEASVLGTPRFMAPEVVRGEAAPSKDTDRFSLAVLLFYMLMLAHPLDGKKESAIRCFDAPAMKKLYGTEPVFIFDPNDRSNEPVVGFHDNALESWSIYPKFLQDLFVRSFTEGIKDPANGRVTESEWRSAMVRLRDSIVYCGHCGLENFYNIDELKTASAASKHCWSCKTQITLPFRIRIGRHSSHRSLVVMLNHDTKLFPYHISDSGDYDFSSPVAEVTRHPSNPNIWGLKNLSKEKWVIPQGDGSMLDVEPGRSTTLAVGTKIQFGKTEGEVRL